MLEKLREFFSLEAEWKTSSKLAPLERVRVWAAYLADSWESAFWDLSSLADSVDSPIEERMLLELWAVAGRSVRVRVEFGRPHVAPLAPTNSGPPPPIESGRGHDALLIIRPQSPVGPYRVDLALDLEMFCEPGAPHRKCVVECDGHDFHEKTRHQTARDKKRDRFLVAEGFHVLRFTGGEIFKDVKGCVNEVMSLLWSAR